MSEQDINVSNIMSELNENVTAIRAVQGIEYTLLNRIEALNDMSNKLHGNASIVIHQMEETTKSAIEYQEMGYVLKDDTEGSGLKRKISMFCRRMIRKITRFLILDQKQFNVYMIQNLQTNIELQKSMLESISELTTEAVELNKMMALMPKE